MDRKQKFMVVLALVVLAIVVTGCAPGDEAFVEKPAGFLAGLWHGLICVITFVLSVFIDSIHMYETSNVGGWYDLGFLIGASGALGGGGFWGGGRRKKD